ncbi:MAG TPA: DUF2442 domain-containing protein [Bryobacteraceae bacterium]|nr:DUF2442 domain-containing protein [Bryobacteraceae bacterium]
MSTSPVKFATEPLALRVRTDEFNLIVDLSDGRVISVPLVWFPRLYNASAEERADYELLGRGIGIHWSRIDEDLSVAGLLLGTH